LTALGGTSTTAVSRGVAPLGDIDADGFADFAISAMLADPDAKIDAGEAYVLYGGPREDCNENGIPDGQDIGDGTSEDCNGNGIPDECDVGDGTSEDCQADGIPDECQLGENDCNDNGVPDECDIAAGTSEDCNGNAIPDECDIGDGTSEDCQPDGIPDECQLGDGDCNDNGVPDECDIVDGTSEDCNDNGVPDECDVLGGTSEDCNGNEIPDECEVYFFFEASPELGPIGDGMPQSYLVAAPPLSGSEVELDFAAIGDFGAVTEWVDVDINGVPVGRVFMYDANDCPVQPDTDVLVVPAENYNQAIGGTDAVVNMVASDAVDPEWCPESLIAVTIQYQAIGPGDCNGNGVPDICDILYGTSLDENGNGIPDECEPECPGDLDGDADVDLSDLAILLANYGETSGMSYEDGDLDFDGDVDLTDLAALLAVYGTSCP